MTLPEITVRIPTPSPADISNNRNVVMAAFQKSREVRIRLNIDIYGPGTEQNPRSRYYSMCGTAPTITCRSMAGVQHTMDRIYQLVTELNGWHPEEEGKLHVQG